LVYLDSKNSLSNKNQGSTVLKLASSSLCIYDVKSSRLGSVTALENRPRRSALVDGWRMKDFVQQNVKSPTLGHFHPYTDIGKPNLHATSRQCVCTSYIWVCVWVGLSGELKLVCKMAAIYIWPGVVCTCHTDFCRLEINRILLSNRKRRAFRKLPLRCHGNAKTTKHRQARIPSHKGGSILQIRVARNVCQIRRDLFLKQKPWEFCNPWNKSFAPL